MTTSHFRRCAECRSRSRTCRRSLAPKAIGQVPVVDGSPAPQSGGDFVVSLELAVRHGSEFGRRVAISRIGEASMAIVESQAP